MMVEEASSSSMRGPTLVLRYIEEVARNTRENKDEIPGEQSRGEKEKIEVARNTRRIEDEAQRDQSRSEKQRIAQLTIEAEDEKDGNRDDRSDSRDQR